MNQLNQEYFDRLRENVNIQVDESKHHRQCLFFRRTTQWDERPAFGFAWGNRRESGIYETATRKKYLEILIGRSGYGIGFVWFRSLPNVQAQR